MLYNPFNALSLLDFSESPPRAFFVAVAYGRPLPPPPPPPFFRAPAAPEVVSLTPREKKKAERERGRGERGVGPASGVGNYVADVN